MNNILEIRNSEDKEFLAFGDESAYKKILAYTHVAFPKSNIEVVVSRLEQLKFSLKINKDKMIHMNELNAQLKEAVVLGCVSILNEFGNLSFSIAPAYSDFSDIGDDEDMKFHVNDKSIIILLMQASLSNFSLLKTNFYIEKDETKIPFLGKKRRKVYNGAPFFSDIGAPKGMVFRIYPQIVTKNFHPLMQIADVMAYVCSHNDQGGGNFYSKSLESVHRQKSRYFQLDAQLKN